MAESFYTILTDTGLAAFANAQVTQSKIDFATFVVGDGNGSYQNPTSTQEELVNEVWRGKISSVSIDEDNPNWVIVETTIPSTEGGFSVREIGVLNGSDQLLAVGKVPETYKPVTDDGSSKDLYLRMILEVSNASVVTLKIDPNVTIATRKYVDDALAEHAKPITSEEGRHGIRYYQGKLEVKVGEQWQTASVAATGSAPGDGSSGKPDGSSGAPGSDGASPSGPGGSAGNSNGNNQGSSNPSQGSGGGTGGQQNGGVGGGGSANNQDRTPPKNVSDIKFAAGDKHVSITWTNPTDDDFKEVIIRYKEGSYPTSHTDGQPGYNGTDTKTTIRQLNNGTKYFFKVYTIDNNNNVSLNTGADKVQFWQTPIPAVTYGVQIDTQNSDPETALTYTDDAETFTKATNVDENFDGGSWLNKFPFNQIKPCVLDDKGEVKYYLDATNFAKKATESGGGDAVLDGTDGNVMIEFPKIYWKIAKSGSTLSVQYSNAKQDGFEALAHKRGDREFDKIYLGAYLGIVEDSKLKSLSDKVPTANKTLVEFRTASQKNGSGFEVMGYYQVVMLQVLYTVMFKNLNSQKALGMGHTRVTGTPITGNANSSSMFYGEEIGTSSAKFAGIENIYGGLSQFIDGIFVDEQGKIFITTDEFEKGATSKHRKEVGQTEFINGSISEVHGTSSLGFLAKKVGGANNTYYCDYSIMDVNHYADFGGHGDSSEDAGIYNLNFATASDGTNEKIGARLMYLPKA